MMIDVCCDGWWMRSLEHTLLSVSVITLVHNYDLLNHVDDGCYGCLNVVDVVLHTLWHNNYGITLLIGKSPS